MRAPRVKRRHNPAWSLDLSGLQIGPEWARSHALLIGALCESTGHPFTKQTAPGPTSQGRRDGREPVESDLDLQPQHTTA